MTVAHGGKAVSGASVGILMLQARFPRIHGDMGNAGTWPFPVLYHVVDGASPERVVLGAADGLLERFIDAARSLVDTGADGITTNCGFLSLFQRELQAAVPVPVVTSSLLQVPFVERILPPGRRAGVLTISAASLSARHRDAAGMPPDTPVMGVDPQGEFATAILGDRLEMDVARARADNLAAAQALVNDHPEVGAIVLECTNMIPYATDIARVTARPVFSMYTLVSWFQSGLVPRGF